MDAVPWWAAFLVGGQLAVMVSLVRSNWTQNRLAGRNQNRCPRRSPNLRPRGNPPLRRVTRRTLRQAGLV